MLNREALGLGVFCVSIWTVRNYDLLIWNSRITKILGLSSTLVSETWSRLSRRIETSVPEDLPKKDNCLALKQADVGVGVIIANRQS